MTSRTAVTSSSPESTAAAALAARLRAAATVLTEPPAPLESTVPLEPAADPATEAAVLLEQLVQAVAAQLTNDRVWLLLTAITASFPLRDEVDETRREFELAGDTTEMCLFLLDNCLPRVSESGAAWSGLRVVAGGVLVEVDQSARYSLHTGIQQVTRNLVPRWDADHPIVPGAWTDSDRCLRSLTTAETNRVLRWNAGDTSSASGSADPEPTELVVPWRAVLVLIDIPVQEASDRLAALAAYSGNRLVAVTHDAVPVSSADMIPPGGSGRFGRYLAAIKYAARVAGVSAAATAEIKGFVDALPSQGLPGPAIVSVPEPTPTPTGAPRPPADGPPMILVVGSHEPRKNHLAILESAETLWQLGLEFQLRFIGGMGWGEAFPARVAELTAKGRDLHVQRAVDDDVLNQAYATASFTMFPSLHEGFGLPVAESLAHRTPVITSNFGSTAEIAVGGGALLVDPRDDAALTAAMRTLLTEPDRLAALRAEIGGRVSRTWSDYAGDLWARLVAPELAAVRESSGPWLP